MTTLTRLSAGEVTAEVIRTLDGRRRVEQFTAASATSTTVVGTGEQSASDDEYNNIWAYVVSGTGAGQTRLVTDYTGSSKTFTVATWTVTPDSTSVIILTRTLRPSIVFDAVVDAIRDLTKDLHTRLTDTSILYGSILEDGGFEYWDSSSTVASGSFKYTRFVSSDGWSSQGTSATIQREATITRNTSLLSAYSCRVNSNSTNDAYTQFLVRNWSRFINQTFDYELWAYATAAARIYGRVDDGVNTGSSSFQTNAGGSSGEHSGTAGWERLERLQFTLDPQMTQLAAQAFVEGTAGGAITAYLGDAGLYPSEEVRAYRILGGFQWLQDVAVERGRATTGSDGLVSSNGTGEGQYLAPVPRTAWTIEKRDDGEPYLVIKEPAYFARKRHLKLIGQGYRTDTIEAATNVEFDPSLVAKVAALKLLTPGDVQYGDLTRDVLDMLEREPDRIILPGSKRVR